MNFKERAYRREQALECVIKAANGIVLGTQSPEVLLFLSVAVTHVTALLGEKIVEEAYQIAKKISEAEANQTRGETPP